jgi:hypothetical protein
MGTLHDVTVDTSLGSAGLDEMTLTAITNEGIEDVKRAIFLCNSLVMISSACIARMDPLSVIMPPDDQECYNHWLDARWTTHIKVAVA